MVNVLAVAPKPFIPGASGGGERWTDEYLRELAKRHRVGIAYGQNYSTVLKSIRHALRTQRWRRTDIDVVHAFQLNSHAFDAAALIARLTRVPLVLTDHGGGWRNIGRVLGRRRLSLIDGVAAVSCVSLNDLSPPYSTPHAVLLAGADHLDQAASSDMSNPAQADGQRAWDFSFVGRLVPHKGPLDFIDALPVGARAIVAGAAMDADFAVAVEHAASAKGIDFELAVSDARVRYIYSQSRWCVFPTRAVGVDGRRLSRPELLGVGPLEAAYCGARSILRPLPAYSEIAPVIDAVVVADQSNRALSEALANALNCDDWVKQPERMTWSNVVSKCERLYASVSDQ